MASDRNIILVRLFLVAGGLLGLSAVAMGALATHLPDRLLAPGGREMLRSAVQMQGWHAAALLICGVLEERAGSRLLRLAGLAFLLGIVCFSAGVYALAFAAMPSGLRGLGHLAPFGGTTLMLGWLVLAISCARRRRP